MISYSNSPVWAAIVSTGKNCLLFYTRSVQVNDMIKARQATIFSLLLIGIAGCFPLDPDRVSSPSYKDGRYRNLAPDEELVGKSLFSVLKWKLFGPHDPPAVKGLSNELPLILERSAGDLIAAEGRIRTVWLGHSTIWISITQKGKTINILTDPIFESPTPVLVDRWVPLPIPKESLPAVDFAIVSHAHRDHLDRDSLRFLRSKNPNLKILLPSGMKAFSEDEKLGLAQVQEIGQVTHYDFVKIIFLPAYHWSRMGVNDTNQYFWGSYVIEAAGKLIYFAGDTGYSIHFKEIAKLLGKPIDLAFLPIGAYKPRWFMKHAHIGPDEALTASIDLGAKSFAPIHWGTFPLGDDLPQEPVLDLKGKLNFPEIPDIKGLNPLYTGISWGNKNGVRVVPWTIGSGIDLE
ncbi:beta-lactamase family protein [Leptospira broomii serovar Hurstbridge str. 5399]|uniref:Beta-lactamase family protein n=1 Tax=Leptospira broomii serovar Hurstbridge str. 5399 TaxID=1049789 RepID=T0FGV5_9LEPT|nr:MBL fold metallo-hydrolase [Leptospira broomii]EQA46857.1 beta-lactamase family protein [Leptospira broomii serovar Hurstbridge str. 5399]